MEVTTWILVGLFIITCMVLWDKLFSKSVYNFPPGPRGLPLIGSPWYLLKETHHLVTELSKTWGEVFTINLLGERIIFLNSAESARAVFASQATGLAFAGRKPAPSVSPHYIHSTIFLGPTQQWSKQRKLIHKILNMYGEGVQETEDVIHEELSHVVEWLETRKGAVNLDEVIDPSLMNILSILLRGDRFDYDSKVLANIKEFIDAGNKSFSTVNNLLLTMLPFLKYVPIGPGKYVQQNRRCVEQFLRDFYDDSKSTYDPDVRRGMIDYLIQHQEESRLADGVTWLKDDSVKAIILEMVDAGSATTRGALFSFFLVILHKPDVAKRIQAEIDDVIGRNRPVKISDRPNMPYTVAAIFELLRYISHVPLAVPHVTTEDKTFNGYHVPKGTTVMPNPWCFHHDETVWPEPWEFRTERFLDNNNKLLPPDHPKRKNLLPFGVGPRACVGEMFARSRMFVFIVTLLQRFDFSPDPDRPLLPCDPRTFDYAAVMWPKDFYVRVTPRDD